MALVVHVGGTRAQWWKDTMQALIPDLECRLWDEPGDDREVEYAAVWKPPFGGLNRFAAGGKILILRQISNKTVKIPFNYNQIAKGENLQQNILIQRGDVVLVP